MTFICCTIKRAKSLSSSVGNSDIKSHFVLRCHLHQKRYPQCCSVEMGLVLFFPCFKDHKGNCMTI